MDINAAMARATVLMIDSIGVAATYTPAGGSAAAIMVLFEKEYREIDLISGTVSSASPAAHCKSADVAAAKKGDALIVAGVSHTVSAVLPDGTGLTTLVMKKA